MQRLDSYGNWFSGGYKYGHFTVAYEATSFENRNWSDLYVLLIFCHILVWCTIFLINLRSLTEFIIKFNNGTFLLLFPQVCWEHLKWGSHRLGEKKIRYLLPNCLWNNTMKTKGGRKKGRRMRLDGPLEGSGEECLPVLVWARQSPRKWLLCGYLHS